ncbi:MAG: hypothetical protein CMD31_07380 [Flavobacteriales bacterium]|nr:hypothetical protein [Flavobacteriales bacterium]|tara:strand:+ start:12671 stop:13630 length:960 start_codon:yes stop_codon:yes gene_type:complete
MNKLYEAKNYFEDLLFGSNSDGIGFINESIFDFHKSNNLFSSSFSNNGSSNDVLSVGIIRNNSTLEVGIANNLINASAYCGCLKNDICRKLMLNHQYVNVVPVEKYRTQLTLNIGDKIGHSNLAKSGSYGTLGFFMLPYTDNKSPLIVSNNHVLADTNSAEIGDSIYSMKQTSYPIGELKDYVPITTGENRLDLAVAQLNGFESSIPKGSATYRQAIIGEKVYKTGATTGKTFGQVRSINYTSKINFGSVDAVFVDQIQITTGIPSNSFSLGGDSGSLIRSYSDNSFLGLLFAGNGTWTLANQQHLVVQQLKQWGYQIK